MTRTSPPIFGRSRRFSSRLVAHLGKTAFIWKAWMTALRNRSRRRRWQRELESLDQQQLDDIGITRSATEITLPKSGRIRFWI